MKRNIMRETNATLDALANAAAEQAPAVAYINEVCEQAPAVVVADVVKRINDWLAVDGHTANDPYIWQQARYIARFVKTHCASCNEDTQDFVYVPGNGTYNGKDGGIECGKCFADKQPTDPEPTIEDILTDALAHNFTPEQIDELAFFPDIDTADAYTWRFELDGKEYTLSYTYATSDVELKQK